MAKKPKDYEEELFKQKESLEKLLRNIDHKAHDGLSGAGFWGLVGTVAIAGDMVLLGGIGTFLFASATAEWAGARLDEPKIQKELKEIDKKIHEYQTLKLTLKPDEEAPKIQEKSIADAFSTLAAEKDKDIERLAKEVSVLRQQLEKISAPTPMRLDKQSIKKPADNNPR